VRPDRSWDNMAGSHGKVLPTLVVIQLVVAILALGVMVYVGVKIGPLLKEKAQLEADIAGYKREVALLKGSLEDTKAELQKTKKELEETSKRLQDTADMARYMHPIEPIGLKAMFSRYPRQAEALEQILKLKQQGVGWHLGGQTPEVGFDSPSFAAYILKELHVPGVMIAPGDTLLATSRRLYESLPSVTKPKVGDLVFYPAGYVLFYFKDRNGKPYVIGMTPVGIAALDPGFAKPVGYRKSGLGH
jgi:hypothetical protein